MRTNTTSKCLYLKIPELNCLVFAKYPYFAAFVTCHKYFQDRYMKSLHYRISHHVFFILVSWIELHDELIAYPLKRITPRLKYNVPLLVLYTNGAQNECRLLRDYKHVRGRNLQPAGQLISLSCIKNTYVILERESWSLLLVFSDGRWALCYDAICERAGRKFWVPCCRKQICSVNEQGKVQLDNSHKRTRFVHWSRA